MNLTLHESLKSLFQKSLKMYLRNLSNKNWKIYQNNKRNLSNTEITQLQKAHYKSPCNWIKSSVSSMTSAEEGQPPSNEPEEWQDTHPISPLRWGTTLLTMLVPLHFHSGDGGILALCIILVARNALCTCCILHVLQNARVASRMYCIIHMLHNARVESLIGCIMHVLKIFNLRVATIWTSLRKHKIRWHTQTQAQARKVTS